MKNIKALTLAFLLTLFGSSYALAEYRVYSRSNGSLAMIDASGTETEGGEKKTKGTLHITTGIGSIFRRIQRRYGNRFIIRS